MKYFVEASWTGVVEVVNAHEFSDEEVEQAAREWLADGIDLKELIRGIRIRGVVHRDDADDAISVTRGSGPLIGYEFVDDDDR